MISTMNEWMADGADALFYLLHILKRGQRSVFSASAVLLYDNMNTRISESSESHFISILQFNLRKLPSYPIHSSYKFFTATRQNKSLV